MREAGLSSGLQVYRLERDGPAGTGLERLTLDPAAFQSALPEQHVHIYFQEAALGLTVGVWTTTSMQEAFGPYPGDEFMCILEGRVVMVDGARGETAVETGQTFCVRNAIPISWKQVGFLRKFYMTYAPPGVPTPRLTTAAGGVIVLDAEALSGRLRVTPDPVLPGRNAIAFTNADGRFQVGLREMEALPSAMQPYPAHEITQVLAGELTVTDQAGEQHHFGPGDVCFIPRGTVVRIEAAGPLRTFFARLTVDA
jgi:hypothetical protein